MSSLGQDVIQGILFLALSIVLFGLSKIAKDILTPYRINDQLKEANLAASVSLSGYLFATIIVILGALLGPSHGLLKDIAGFVGYAFLGIVLLNVSRMVNDRLILRKFSNVKEIIEDRNVGTGAVEFGSYIASGLVVAGAIHGTGGGIDTALTFFVLSQLALILFVRIYDRITSFDVHDEIEKDNVAAGIAFGGTLIALGIILFKGSVGDFISWQYNLLNFFISAGTGVILLPLLRWVVDKLLLPKIDLNQAIGKERNLAIAWFEMTVAISFATILFFSIDFNLAF